MTGYSARLGGRTPKGRNKKDGATGLLRRGDSFEKAGFTLVEPPAKFSYTWKGVFPVFQVKPGIINSLAGIVAQCDDIIEWFPYGTPPGEIKARLDDLILEIMRHDAELDNERLDEPDDDNEWIDVDLWMTRPQAAARQSTPAVQRLATRHGVSLSVADEIMVERGE